MFNPTASEQDIIDFVAETVKRAGGNPCPPIVVGVGIGGSFDYCAVLAKKALIRTVGAHSEQYGELEQRILDAVNETGVGPAGLGGRYYGSLGGGGGISLPISPDCRWQSISPVMPHATPR